MNQCMCDGWRKSMNEITNGQTILALIKGIKYTGDPFKFCPWCGKAINPIHSKNCICKESNTINYGKFDQCLDCGLPK